MSAIEWEDPAPAGKGIRSVYWADLAATLRANPERWAVIETGAPFVAIAIKQGRYSAFRPPGAFEAVTRTVDGEIKVYARFVGESS